MTWSRLLVRLLVIWLSVGWVFYQFGAPVMAMLLPILTWYAGALGKPYLTQLFLGEGEQGTVINIVAQLTQNIYLEHYPIAPQGAQFAAAGTLLHALSPVVILFSLLLAWPGNLRLLALRLLTAIPVAIAILCVTTVPLLMGHIEEILHAALEAVAKREMPMPPILYWVMTMELGGIWLLPLVGALGCLAFAQRLTKVFPVLR